MLMFCPDSRRDYHDALSRERICLVYLQAHHLKVIERLKALFQDDPRYLALLVGGSLVKGWGSIHSDVDILLVVTEEEYARRVATDDLGYYNAEICDYSEGYVDGKIMNEAFLHDVAQRGSEPARAAFINVHIAFSHLPHFNELLKQIPVYQEHEREKKMRSLTSETGRSLIHGEFVSCTIANGPGAVDKRHWQIGKAKSMNF
jgi:hypothetical protein